MERKKIMLSKETIRVLTNSDLMNANGGWMCSTWAPTGPNNCKLSNTCPKPP